jgi:hypothetical protein
MRKILSIVSIAVALLLPVACSKSDSSGWYMDPAFSDQLVSFNEANPAFVRQDPAIAVEVLQIFRSERKDDVFGSLSDLRAKLLVYETRNRDEIRSFFRATRILSDERCPDIQGDYVFSILAFDPSLIRLGYIKYYPCKRSDLGWFVTLASNSVYESSATAKVFNSIIPRSLQMKSK